MAKKRVKTGQMRERVEFLTIGDAPFGVHSIKRTTTVATTRWARVIEYSVAARNNRGLAESVTHRIEVREGADVAAIDNNNLIRWRSKLYKVASTNTIGAETGDPRNQFRAFDVEYQGTEDAYDNPSPEEETP